MELLGEGKENRVCYSNNGKLSRFYANDCKQKNKY